MTDNFPACLDFTFGQEGGLVDDPDDPGGLTNLGITLAVWNKWNPSGAAGLRAATKDQVTRIYRGDYWLEAGCDKLPPGVDLMVFDAAVNMGPARSVGYLQVVAGTIQDDVDGPMTEAAIAKMDPEVVIERLSDLHLAHYRALPTFNRFGKGWVNRDYDALAAAKAMAFAASGQPPAATPPA